MRIEVTRLADDLLSGKTWEFWFFESESALVLDRYVEMSRPTKRHKYKADKYYSRLYEKQASLSEEEVRIPHDVAEEAHSNFCSLVGIRKWSEVRNEN